jgi:hypothetical protein
MDDMFNVRVAVVTLLIAKAVFSRFQVSVIGPFAVVGVQFVVDKLSVTCALPRFFI